MVDNGLCSKRLHRSTFRRLALFTRASDFILLLCLYSIEMDAALLYKTKLWLLASQSHLSLGSIIGKHGMTIHWFLYVLTNCTLRTYINRTKLEKLLYTYMKLHNLSTSCFDCFMGTKPILGIILGDLAFLRLA